MSNRFKVIEFRYALHREVAQIKRDPKGYQFIDDLFEWIYMQSEDRMP